MHYFVKDIRLDSLYGSEIGKSKHNCYGKAVNATKIIKS